MRQGGVRRWRPSSSPWSGDPISGPDTRSASPRSPVRFASAVSICVYLVCKTNKPAPSAAHSTESELVPHTFFTAGCAMACDFCRTGKVLHDADSIIRPDILLRPSSSHLPLFPPLASGQMGLLGSLSAGASTHNETQPPTHNQPALISSTTHPSVYQGKSWSSSSSRASTCGPSGTPRPSCASSSWAWASPSTTTTP